MLIDLIMIYNFIIEQLEEYFLCKMYYNDYDQSKKTIAVNIV